MRDNEVERFNIFLSPIKVGHPTVAADARSHVSRSRRDALAGHHLNLPKAFQFFLLTCHACRFAYCSQGLLRGSVSAVSTLIFQNSAEFPEFASAIFRIVPRRRRRSSAVSGAEKRSTSADLDASRGYRRSGNLRHSRERPI